MESAAVKVVATPNRSWHFVRIAVAVLLLTASALKCWQLATEPIIGTSLLDSRWLLMATVEFELFFGIWLLANIWAKPSWAAALACFGLFTCVSFCKALSGHATCGCFGRIPVNPWYTGVIDLAVMASLLRWRPKESFFTIRRAIVVLVVWLLIGVPTAFAMGSYTETTLSDAGEIIGDGKIVVLKPETWIGKRFSLLPFIEDVPSWAEADQQPLRERLTEGEWIVLLYHHDCPKCQKVMAKYGKPMQCSILGATSPRVALIELPPYGKNGTSLPPNASFVVGRLSREKEWTVETPVVLTLLDSIVGVLD